MNHSQQRKDSDHVDKHPANGTDQLEVSSERDLDSFETTTEHLRCSQWMPIRPGVHWH